VSAWTEAESAQKGASSAQEQVASQAEEVQQRRLEPGRVIRERDQLRSHAAEAMSRADVLGGQLAEATERDPGGVTSARARRRPSSEAEVEAEPWGRARRRPPSEAEAGARAEPWGRG
jgi:hypothetical protein